MLAVVVVTEILVVQQVVLAGRVAAVRGFLPAVQMAYLAQQILVVEEVEVHILPAHKVMAAQAAQAS
jgi:hypothetical protein